MSEAEQQFWSKVHKSSDGCWLWSGYVGREGYGRTYYAGRKGLSVHRLAYELSVGPIPPGLVIDHLCRVHNCVNPDHLEPVTNRENVLRGIGLAVIHKNTTQCPQGHPYSSDNTYISPQGKRGCRVCRNKASREWLHRSREATRAREQHA
jgi:hypothetical protein